MNGIKKSGKEKIYSVISEGSSEAPIVGQADEI